jgi:Mrp family chromosome partitioning ATPase
LQDEARDVLGQLKDDQGVSILDSKMIESIEVSPDKEITVKLHLNKNYRKAKTLITSHLQA